jgi:hypothetical protein
LAEQLICNQQVIGSSPIAGSSIGSESMKYILDIILVIAVVWVVNLWNGQRLKDLAKQAYHVNAPKDEKASGGEE